MSTKLTALSIFLLATFIWSQDSAHESALARNTRVLSISGQRESQVPFFGAFGFPQCDSEGNLYFHLDKGDFVDSDVLLLSADGQKGKIFKFSGEYADLEFSILTNFYVSGGFLIIGLSGDTENILEKRKFVVLEVASGRLYAVYERPEELHRAQDVCFTREQGFTFMISDNGRTTLFTAPLR